MSLPVPKALSRFKVLDLTRARAGPNCVRQFADFGADVVMIEPPATSASGGQFTGHRDGFDMQNLHRNVRALTLDLKHPEGRELFLRLVARADVVVENFRPDVKHRLGIGYEALREINPKIVLASISGFGQEGPYVDRPMFDQIAQGMSGIMSVTGEPGGPPLRAGVAVTDMTAGYLTALGIMTALLEREVSGVGQWVQCSLVQAGVAMMDFQAAHYLRDHQIPVAAGNNHPKHTPSAVYLCTDGYFSLAATGQAMWERLCQALGREDLGRDPRFATEKSRVDHRETLNALLGDVFATQSKNHWVDLFNRAGIAAGPIYNTAEAFADPQMQTQGLVAQVQHPRLGNLDLVNQPVKLSRTPAEIHSSAPDLGEHTDIVLREYGCSADEIRRWREQAVI